MILSAAALLLLFELSEIDRGVARQFFDAAQNSFPLKRDWLLVHVFHRGPRSVSVLAGCVVFAGALVAWVAPQRCPRLARYRAELSFLAAALLIAPLVVGGLKYASRHACPWDTAGFGGNQPYRHLLEPSSMRFQAEGCLPAAHPVSGYAWLALALVLYPRRRAAAHGWWIAAFAFGSALGAVQMMRGAHFLSHVLWSGWVVWVVDIALLRAALLFTFTPRAREV